MSAPDLPNDGLGGFSGSEPELNGQGIFGRDTTVHEEWLPSSDAEGEAFPSTAEATGWACKIVIAVCKFCGTIEQQGTRTTECRYQQQLVIVIHSNVGIARGPIKYIKGWRGLLRHNRSEEAELSKLHG